MLEFAGALFSIRRRTAVLSLAAGMANMLGLAPIKRVLATP
jgi:hypothetical protein